MSEETRILLYSDGSEVGSRALDLGQQIALAMGGEVDILDTTKTAETGEAVHEEIEAIAEELRASDVPVTVHQRPGLVAHALIHQADAVDYDLVVVGSRGRRGIRRLIAGSRACTVLGGTAASVLIVKGRERKAIDQILLCSAAGPVSEKTVRFAARLARALDASITLLHVMSQVALEGGAKAADLDAGAEELMARDAPEGVHLEEMLDILRDQGVDATVLVRHGLVVEEIIHEAQEGHSDMIIIGAHTTPGIRELLSSDLSRKIMLSANRSVLIVRQD